LTVKIERAGWLWIPIAKPKLGRDQQSVELREHGVFVDEDRIKRTPRRNTEERGKQKRDDDCNTMVNVCLPTNKLSCPLRVSKALVI
jgi:hypothetical protein